MGFALEPLREVGTSANWLALEDQIMLLYGGRRDRNRGEMGEIEGKK